MSKEALIPGGDGGGGTPEPPTPDSDPSPSNPQPPESFSVTLGDDGNKLPDNWYGGLPEEMHRTLKGANSLEELARGNYGLRKQLGDKGNYVKPITSESSDEEIAAWRKAHGVPEAGTVEAYGFELPEELPEGLDKELIMENIPGYLEIIHKHGGTPALLKELVEYNLKTEGQALIDNDAASVANHEKQVEELKAEWGSDWDKNIAGAGRMAELAGLDKDSALRYNPEFTKAMAQLSTLIGEDSLPKGEQSLSPGIMSPEQKREYAVAIQTGVGADAEAMRLHELYKAGNPAAVARVRQLLAGN